MIASAIGAFIGALLTLLISIFIEFQRKPKLNFEIESPPHDQDYKNAPATKARFLRVHLKNSPMPQILMWLNRNAAMQCKGEIQFCHFEDGSPIFARDMSIRWAGSDEPISFYALQNKEVAQLFDAAKYNAAFYRNCFPGTFETIDVAARFDDDDSCFGWCNENYLPGKGWRNRDWEIPKGRYLVKITVQYSGDKKSELFQLENSIGIKDFRLMNAKDADYRKVGMK